MGNQNLNDRPQLEFPLDNELRTPRCGARGTVPERA